MPVQLISFSAYARHRRCDEKAVRKAVSELRITAIEREGRKWIDPDVADIQWARNTRPRMNPGSILPDSAAPAQTPDRIAPGAMSTHDAAPVTPPSGAAPPPDAYSTHKAREAAASADMAEMRAAAMSSLLLKRDDIERGVFEVFRSLRDQCFAAAKHQASQVIGLTELREIETLLEDGYRQAFAAAETQLVKLTPPTPERGA